MSHPFGTGSCPCRISVSIRAGKFEVTTAAGMGHRHLGVLDPVHWVIVAPGGVPDHPELLGFISRLPGFVRWEDPEKPGFPATFESEASARAAGKAIRLFLLEETALFDERVFLAERLSQLFKGQIDLDWLRWYGLGTEEISGPGEVPTFHLHQCYEVDPGLADMPSPAGTDLIRLTEGDLKLGFLSSSNSAAKGRLICLNHFGPPARPE